VSRPGGELLYFAYGANVHPGWLRRRIPAAVALGCGELPGHRLVFHKRGRDGAGRSNAWRTGVAADRLPGALYRLPADDLARLGAAGAGYQADEVVVETAAGSRTAVTWRAEPAEIAPGLLPWDWYVALIRAGGALHGLPEAHLRWLASVPLRVDPDRARAATAFAVIEAATGEP
jgi:hypothetical protein